MTIAIIIICILTVLINEGWNIYKRVTYVPPPPPPPPKPQPDLSGYDWEVRQVKNIAQQVDGYIVVIYHHGVEIGRPIKVESEAAAQAVIRSQIKVHAEHRRYR